MARFCPLFSGSSGNAYYFGLAESGILIDAGRSAKQLTAALENCGLEMKAVRGIFITHEHSDHICGLRVLASRHHIPVYATEGTLGALEEAGCLTDKFSAEPIPAEGMECAGMHISSFHTSHDSAESAGFRIDMGNGRVAAVATDLGYMSDEVRDAVSGADLLVLESNHDEGMLRSGPYPYPLKKRILSQRGHLSNMACASELVRLAEKGTTRFWLAHLSHENNTPDLAYETSRCSLTMAGLKEGLDYELNVAPRENETGRFIVF